MVISLSLTTVILLFCSSACVTTLVTDAVGGTHPHSSRTNAAAHRNPLTNENTLASHKRHDLSQSPGNHIAARAGPAPAIKAQDPTTEVTDPQSNEATQSESNESPQQQSDQPGTQRAPKQPAEQNQEEYNDNDENDEDDDDEDDDDGPDPPETPKHNENGESGESDSDGHETPEHPDPEDNFNSTTTRRCAHQSGADSANSGHCIASATSPPKRRITSPVVATTSSFSFSFSSSSAPPAAAVTSVKTATQAVAPSSSSSTSINAPTTTPASPATGAAAGIDARNPFLMWVRIKGGDSATTTTTTVVFGAIVCAVTYISSLI